MAIWWSIRKEADTTIARFYWMLIKSRAATADIWKLTNVQLITRFSDMSVSLFLQYLQKLYLWHYV